MRAPHKWSYSLNSRRVLGLRATGFPPLLPSRSPFPAIVGSPTPLTELVAVFAERFLSSLPTELSLGPVLRIIFVVGEAPVWPFDPDDVEASRMVGSRLEGIGPSWDRESRWTLLLPYFPMVGADVAGDSVCLDGRLDHLAS